MEEPFFTRQESKEMIWRITQEIIPSANVSRSINLFRNFRDLYYPTTEKKAVAELVLDNPQEYKNFCKNLILKYNKLPEDDFRHLINQINKLNLEQIEIMLNKVLLAKLDVLHLIRNPIIEKNEKSSNTAMTT